jgi:hypothetical protein
MAATAAIEEDTDCLGQMELSRDTLQTNSVLVLLFSALVVAVMTQTHQHPSVPICLHTQPSSYVEVHRR